MKPMSFRVPFLFMVAFLLSATALESGIAQTSVRNPKRTETHSSSPPFLSLLDIGGRLREPLSRKTVRVWQAEANAQTTSPLRRAQRWVWLGEWELAEKQEPKKALALFEKARCLSRPPEVVYGVARFDTALTLLQSGHYAAAKTEFGQLLERNSKVRGFDVRTCALWYRHASACAGYHEVNRKLGIPEIGGLDPLCGPAALATCLQSQGLLCEKKVVLANCRMTGFGATMHDLEKAAERLGATAHTVSTDEEGLKALPMPVIAHVENDHFIAIIQADEHYVTYVCSDCGDWPGGDIRLTWKQWRAMNPGLYMTVSRQGSPADRLMQEALCSPQTRRNGVELASHHSLSLAYKKRLLRLRGRLAAYVNPNVYCGYRPNSPKCPSGVICPVDGPGGSGNGGDGNPGDDGPGSGDDPGNDGNPGDDGPGCGDPVNLASGEEEYHPRADLHVYNPQGPSVSWKRIYGSLRSNLGGYYQFDDHGTGWSHQYNLLTYVMGSQIHLVFPTGSQYTFTGGYVPDATRPQVDCLCDTLGVPMLVRWEYLGMAGYRFTVLHSNHSKWIFSSLNRSRDGNPAYSLEQIVNRTGQAIHFIYDGYGPLTPGNSAGFPLLVSIRDDANQPLITISRSRDGKANITLISDRYGRSVLYKNQHFANLNVPNGYPQSQEEMTFVSQIAPTGTITPPMRYQYGYALVSNGEGSEQTAALKTITVPSPTGAGTSTATLNYNGGIFISSLVDGNGNTRTYRQVDALHTEVTVANAQGVVAFTYTSEFDSQMRSKARKIGSQGVLTGSTQYNAANYIRPDSVTDGNSKTTSYQWDQFGNLLSVTTPRGAVTVYTWDYSASPLGDLKKVQTFSAAGNRQTPTTFTYYQPSGLIKTLSSPRPGSTDGISTVTSSFTYDALGNLLSASTPGNNATTTIATTYNYTTDGNYSQAAAMGQPLTSTNNLGKTTHFRYDNRGRLTQRQDALGYTTSYAYNNADQLSQTDSPYDPVPANTVPWRTVTRYSYFYPGSQLQKVEEYQVNKTTGTATLFRRVLYGYGKEGEFRTVKGSAQNAAYDYDGAYRLQTLTDGNGNPTLYAYNDEGYLKSVVYPNGDTFQYPDYDPNGRPKKRIDGRGIVTLYRYDDPDNGLTDIQYQNSSLFPGIDQLNVNLKYDEYGRWATVTDGSGRMSYGYDDRNVLTGTTTAYKSPTGTFLPNSPITYAFYPDGSRQSMGTPAGTFTYHYDEIGRAKDLTNPFNETFSWGYGDNNWLASQRLGNAAITTYSYAPGYGWKTGVTTRKLDAGSTLLSQFTGLTYDPAYNLTSVGASLPAAPTYSGQTSYEYASMTAVPSESKDELSRETSTRGGGYDSAFRYDAAGNPLLFKGVDPTNGSGYNAANQNPVFGYDKNGNPTNYKGVACAYDPEDRLTKFGNALTAGYSATGLRAWKQSGNVRTYFLYDGLTPVCELGADGSVLATNTFGANGLLARRSFSALKPVSGLKGAEPEVGERISVTAASSVFYTFDQQGSVAQRLNPDGSIRSSHLFDAFGVSASILPDPFGYNGQWGYYSDGETGLYQLGHRYYDPSTGRFLTRDPIGSRGGVNLYGHVGNNPINWSDPTGYQVAETAAAGACLLDPPCAAAAILIVGATYCATHPPKFPNFLSSDNSGSDAGGKEGDRNPNQDRKLTDDEIRKLQKGGEDPHDLKEDVNSGQRDLYKDKNGNIYVKPKGGSGPGEPTGLNINHF